MPISTLKITAIGIVGMFLFCFGCKSLEDPPKSDLVKKLETIFYDDAFASIPNKTFNVSEFGAVMDSLALNTDAIQKTIDAAHQNWGWESGISKGYVFIWGHFFKIKCGIAPTGGGNHQSNPG